MKKGYGILLVAILLAGLLLWQTRSAWAPGQNTQDEQAAAIKAAKLYRPAAGTVCTDALTAAVHTASGAHYTFPSGCLAPGWKVDSQSQ
jgi:hypothetical protein